MKKNQEGLEGQNPTTIKSEVRDMCGGFEKVV